MKRWNFSLRKRTRTNFKNQDVIIEAIQQWFPEFYISLEEYPQIKLLINGDKTRNSLDLFHEKTIKSKGMNYNPI